MNLSTTRNLFRCVQCGHHSKLPWKSDTLSWCPNCSTHGPHALVIHQVDPREIGERMNGFVERMAQAHRMSAKTLPVPPTAQEITDSLRSAGYPLRAIQGLTSMKGHGRDLSDKIFNSEKRDANWIIYGKNGRGKTSIATRVAALRTGKRKSAGRYMVVPDLRELLQSAMTRNQDQMEITRPLTTTPLLVLDEAQDIGDRDKDWLIGILRRIADARYREFRPTIWLMNAEKEQQVVECLGSRIVDRAEETGGLILCNWPSYRE